jgi:hypothetical protein
MVLALAVEKIQLLESWCDSWAMASRLSWIVQRSSSIEAYSSQGWQSVDKEVAIALVIPEKFQS